MSSIVLRPATAVDAPALAALGRESFVAKFGHLYRSTDLESFLADAHSLTKVASEIEDPVTTVMLAERDGRLVGFCKLVLACGWPEHARGRRAVELKQLYTAPDAIGSGIGAALMDWALGESSAQGADEIQLSVWSGNEGAQRFYKRYRFEKMADIDFWVGAQRDDEFLFARVL